MKVRSVELIVLLGLAAAGVWYLVSAVDFLEAEEQDYFLNPGFFPTILGCALLLFIAVSLLQTLLSKTNREAFPERNTRRVLLVIGLTAGYLLLWSTAESLFYLFTVLFFLAVSLVLTLKRGTPLLPAVLKLGLVAVLLTGLVYLIFDATFGISLT
ncbi:tripartite tricarboxylate transporter TctB family protein [Nesterenkonia sp. HG001]|uniref:tripartite tricarboxylate transporter TctB family protein n=1 Tax=Nesterenkonia sp. HG001 TaxID=2983207 RepID=UPI002AC4371B|nr:tripartite tricarboxylate transporter TctB family protein [Nesterenkonia sp. HG001]MDZ5077540.1 tripartite tricarboxylate transporter TctB family protein [Nesterenkonia sp. HG001]